MVDVNAPAQVLGVPESWTGLEAQPESLSDRRAAHLGHELNRVRGRILDHLRPVADAPSYDAARAHLEGVTAPVQVELQVWAHIRQAYAILVDQPAPTSTAFNLLSYVKGVDDIAGTALEMGFQNAQRTADLAHLSIGALQAAGRNNEVVPLVNAINEGMTFVTTSLAFLSEVKAQGLHTDVEHVQWVCDLIELRTAEALGPARELFALARPA